MDYQMIGMMSQHLIFSNDDANITSKNNSYIYDQILSGNYDSPAFNYMMNYGANRLSDVKSIMFFNEANLAAMVNEARGLEEVTGDEETVALSKKPVKIKKRFTDILEQRHSGREYVPGVPMSLEELSTILKYSNGLARRVMTFGDKKVTTRYHGSGGGLYPITMYLLINKVEGIRPGVYRYQPYSDTLRFVTDSLQIEKLFPYGTFDLDNYSFTVLYAFDANRTYVKYGELSLLIALVEIGLIAENLDLTAAALDFTSCQAAGFQKRYAESKLHLDGVNSHVLYTQICGRE